MDAAIWFLVVRWFQNSCCRLRKLTAHLGILYRAVRYQCDVVELKKVSGTVRRQVLAEYPDASRGQSLFRRSVFSQA